MSTKKKISKKSSEKDQFIVFYKEIGKSRIWPELPKFKMPKGWIDGGSDGILPGILDNKYNSEGWFNGKKQNSKEMKEYLKKIYTEYKRLGYCSNFTIRKKYPNKKK